MRIGSSGRGAVAAPLPGDPNPESFEILSIDSYSGSGGGFCVAVIRWHGAENFDGRKVAVYEASPVELRTARRLDPHFQERLGPLVPVARFEPTGRGVAMAHAVASELAGKPAAAAVCTGAR